MREIEFLPTSPVAQLSYEEQEELNREGREQNENGQEDRYLDSSYEDRTEMDFGD